MFRSYWLRQYQPVNSIRIGLDEEKRWIIADLYLEKGIRPDQLLTEIYKLLKL